MLNKTLVTVIITTFICLWYAFFYSNPSQANLLQSSDNFINSNNADDNVAEFIENNYVVIIKNFKVGEQITGSLDQYPKPSYIKTITSKQCKEYTWTTGNKPITISHNNGLWNSDDELTVCVDQNGTVKSVSLIFHEKEIGQEVAKLIEDIYLIHPTRNGAAIANSTIWEWKEPTENKNFYAEVVQNKQAMPFSTRVSIQSPYAKVIPLKGS